MPTSPDLAPALSVKPRRFAISIALSLLLHIAVLFVMREPTTTSFSVAKRAPITVFFVVPPIQERQPAKISVEKQNNSARLITAPATAKQDELPGAGIAPETRFNPQQMLEFARDIARDEAITTERRDAAQEQKRRNTPLVALEQYLRQPHKEIHLANGIVKIVTALGEICFRPAPNFVSDDLGKGAFGMPTTCP